MGEYFSTAKTVKDLSPEQQERYKFLRASGAQLPAALKSRFEAIKEQIGPITSGEIWEAFDELWQDAIVCWILSGEDANITWIDLFQTETNLSEKAQRRADKPFEDLQTKLRDQQERLEREGDQWEKENYPIRYFFRQLIARLRR